MKKRIHFLLLFFFIIAGIGKNLQAQSLHFCDSISNNEPYGIKDDFLIDENGCSVCFLVVLTEAVNCTYVNYVIYKLDDNYEEEYTTTFLQDGMENEWTWFWKVIDIYSPGVYVVYVHDCNSNLLAKETLTVHY